LSILHWYLGLLNEDNLNSFVIDDDIIVYQYIKASIENNNFEMLIYLDKQKLFNSRYNKSLVYWFDFIFKDAICQANISVVKWLIEKKIALSKDINFMQRNKNELFIQVKKKIQRELSAKNMNYLKEDDYCKIIVFQNPKYFVANKITEECSERIVSYFQNHPVFHKFFK